MFVDRTDAGKQLGRALEKYRSSHPLVLGIPRGGIEVGYYVAGHLQCDFDTLVVRKLGYPQQPEAAFGALAEDGSLYLDPWSNRFISKELIEKVQKKEKEEIKRRITIYRQGRNLTPLRDRVVIIVDDGIASGATIFAAIDMCRKKQPQKLVVAAPVSGVNRLARLETSTDEVVILDKREEYHAVSEAYVDFINLSDEDVIKIINRWQQKTGREINSE